MKTNALQRGIGTLLAALLLASGLALAATAFAPAQAHAKATSISIGSKYYSGKWKKNKTQPVKSFKYKKISWSAKTQTLTIKKAKKVKNITISGTGTVKIKIVGKCSMKKNAEIYAYDAKIKFTGKGSLTLSGKNAHISAKTASFAGPSVKISGTDTYTPVSTSRGVTVSKGNLTIVNPREYAIGCSTDGSHPQTSTVKVSGGTLKVEGKSFARGIRSDNITVTGGKLIMTGGCDLMASSKTYRGKQYGGNLTISGGTVDIKGSIDAITTNIKKGSVTVGGNIDSRDTNISGGTVKVGDSINDDYAGDKMTVNITGGSTVVKKCIYATNGNVYCTKAKFGSLGKAYYYDSKDNYIEGEPTLVHSTLSKVGRSGSCATGGYYAHYVCTKCKRWTKDAKGKNTIWDHSDIKYGKNEHTYKLVKKVAATCTNNGVDEHYQCTRCGKWFSYEWGDYEEHSKSYFTLKPHENDGSFTFVSTSDSSCPSAGYYEHYVCKNCGKWFEWNWSGDGYYEQHDKSYFKLDPHDYYAQTTLSYVSSNGIYDSHYECSGCGKWFSDDNEKYNAAGDNRYIYTEHDKSYFEW